MLKLYLDSVPASLQKDVVEDVETGFLGITLTGSKLEKKLLCEIEQAKFLDSQSFIDRFGFKLYNGNLSTGCKAAMCVLHYPDKIVSLQECGQNARDIIINFCGEGGVVTRDNSITFAYYSDSVDVSFEGHEFRDLSLLNEYIQNPR